MDERILKWLYDIRFAVAEIDSYFENSERTFADYQQNSMRKRAVEIIGEAVNRILKRDENYIEKITIAQAIIGLRNQVIHAMIIFRMKISGLFSSITCQN